MPDPIVREARFVVTYAPDGKTFEVTMPPSQITAVELWSILNLAVTQLARFAPYLGDPIERANIIAAADGMKYLIKGAEAAVEEQKKSRENVNREMGGASGKAG